MATTSPAQPPEHLTEVFRFLSSSTTTAAARTSAPAYETFQSSYYFFRNSRLPSVDPTASMSDTLSGRVQSVDAVDAGDTGSQPRILSLLTPHGQQTVAAAPQNRAAPLPRPASPSSLPASERDPHSPSPSPPAPLTITTAAADADALPMFQRTVPSPVVQSKKQKDRAAQLDLGVASVGSTELPVEQQPDAEFPSPVSQHTGASTTAAGSTRSPLPATEERSRELTSFSRLALHTISGVPAESAGVRMELSPSGSYAAPYSAGPHVSFGDVGAGRAARSCSVASLVERRSSQLFLNGESMATFPGARRVSLRRPVFDEDDE